MAGYLSNILLMFSEIGIYYINISYDKFSKVVVDFSSIRGQKLFGWMLIFNLF